MQATEYGEKLDWCPFADLTRHSSNPVIVGSAMLAIGDGGVHGVGMYERLGLALYAVLPRPKKVLTAGEDLDDAGDGVAFIWCRPMIE